jgi:glutaredoxin-like YruB-family protein
MKTTTIASLDDLRSKLKSGKHTYVLIYKQGTDLSKCALQNIERASSGNENFELLTVDVSEVRDVHPAFSINSAPTLLQFSGTDLKNTFKGCNDSVYYKTVFENMMFYQSSGSDRPRKRVTVYTTPTCSWCNTLKTHLRKNGISFREVDISKDQKAAEALVRRSGQQGVPQTDINGQIIVGFDRDKINKLLEIQSS